MNNRPDDNATSNSQKISKSSEQTFSLADLATDSSSESEDDVDEEEEQSIMAIDLTYTRARSTLSELVEIMRDPGAGQPHARQHIEAELKKLDPLLLAESDALIKQVTQKSANNPARFLPPPAQAGAGAGAPNSAQQPRRGFKK